MDGTHLERPLRDVREIERSLRAKLRSYRLPEAFIDRCGEDALQKGIVEYLRARSAGAEIRDPGGFVVQAAFRRAIDELRREAREVHGVALDRLLEAGRSAAPAAEEVAIERMTAERLREAIDGLPPEERQALSLYYFEELSNHRAAEILYCSERTFRRRLGSALGHLSRAIGAPAPKPGSDLALEVGVLCWVSSGGARVLVSTHPLASLSGTLESAATFLARQVDRLKGPAARLSSGGGASEQIGAIASGPAGKVIGGCAGAAILCALTGVVATNVELGQQAASPDAPPPRHAAAPYRVRPPQRAVAEPTTGKSESSSPPTTQFRERRQTRPAQAGGSAVEAHRPANRHDAEEEQLEQQMSGITRAAQEADAESAPSASAVAPVESVPAESQSPAGSPPPSAAAEELAVEKQIRGPLAP